MLFDFEIPSAILTGRMSKKFLFLISIVRQCLFENFCDKCSLVNTRGLRVRRIFLPGPTRKFQFLTRPDPTRPDPTRPAGIPVTRD